MVANSELEMIYRFEDFPELSDVSLSLRLSWFVVVDKADSGQEFRRRVNELL